MLRNMPTLRDLASTIRSKNAGVDHIAFDVIFRDRANFERVRALAKELCAVTGADPKLVERAALLCKMDLVTETVGEFPELQGQVGRQICLAELTQPPPREGRGQGAG